ncbi:MAG: hypothetical protein RJB60_2301 [Pseudomonadota bacterium]|jgi:hypothetical protein
MDHPINSLLQAERGRIEGWPAWGEHVRAALQEAAEHASAIHLQDPDFAHWPLGERACVESLERWVLAPGRARATFLALGWDAVVRRHPRWLRWRTPWGHRVACLTVPEDQISSMTGFAPLLLIEGRLALQISDAEHGFGHWSRDASTVRALWLQCDAISQRSLDSGISATLGL